MNLATAIAPPRRLVRLWRVVREGLPSAGRYRRYGLSIAPVLAAIWGAAGAYLLLVPASYDSRFSLILPGSGMGSSLNVESIGQAQASAASAFSSSTLSPTENYRQLLSADVTLRDAAARSGEAPDTALPAPRIKLIDQTNLIDVSVSGDTPAEAHRRARALIGAFSSQLDRLRADEAELRARSDIARLRDLAEKVRASQRRLIAFQAENGLASLDQFHARISAVDTLRDKERELRLQARLQSGQARRLGSSLGSTPASADVALRLRGDPVFQELAQRYATANADAEQKSATLGPRHAAMAAAEGERSQLRSALVARGREITGLGGAAILKAVDLTIGDGRSNLMQAMDISDAQAAGSRAALTELRGDLSRARASVPQLMEQAATLADLQRDQRVTEAVFSSAMARLETNKQDPFASYPLVQVLAAPSLPDRPTSPSTAWALLGAAAATFLALVGFALAWLRQPILDRLLKNG